MKKLNYSPLWYALACVLMHGRASATDIPLDLIQLPNGGSAPDYRLGINVGLNGGTRQEYLFDTGSDSFNIAVGSGGGAVPWFPNWNASATGSQYVFNYGDGTTGYWQQNTTASSVQFYNANTGKQVFSAAPSQGLPVAAALDWVMTANHFAPNVPGGDIQGVPVATGMNSSGQPVTMYQDLSWQQALDQGAAPEHGHFYGTFGAGDFLYAGDNGGLPGMLTTTGYIVEANGKAGAPGSCGQACFILGLTPALRAQFLSVVPWVAGTQQGTYQGSFGVSGAHAAQQFDTYFTYSLNNGAYTAKLQTVLDSGTSGVYLNDNGLTAGENAAGHVNANGNESAGLTLTAIGAVPGAKTVSLTTADDGKGDPTHVVGTGNAASVIPSGTALYGMSFFLNNAVMYDLENQVTAYTPFYVTDAPLTTDLTVTQAMGPLGLAGVISGSGAFTVANGGMANLSGANTYTGNTVVEQGGWLGLAGPIDISTSAGMQADGTFDMSRAAGNVSIKSLSGSGTGYLGGNTLVLTQASGTFSGQLADGGLGGGTGAGLTIDGGEETLAGDNAYSGLTRVSAQATLHLQGAVGSVLDAGMLTGNGLIRGDLMVAGTVAPGIVNGTYQILSVNGRYNQAAGATYVAQWNVGQAGVSSQILVGGSGILQSGAIIELVPSATSIAAFQGTRRYTLLTANGGLSGNYTIVGDTGLSPLLKVVPVYDGNHVYLDVSYADTSTPSPAPTPSPSTTPTPTPTPSPFPAPPAPPVVPQPPPLPLFATAAHTPNQMAVLTAVQNMPSYSAPFVVLANLQGDAQLRDAADQLSGEIYASAQSTYLENSRIVRDAVTTRLAQADLDAYGIDAASTQSVKAQSNGLTWWGQSIGSWGHEDGTSNNAALSRTTGGFLAGADVPVGESSRIGVVGGYTKTSLGIPQRGSSLSSDDVHVGLYAGTSLGALALSAGGDYTRHGITANRRVATADFSDNARSSTAARTAEYYGNAAYRFSFKQAIVEPFAQVAYVKLANDSFQERDSLMALAVQGSRHAVTYTTLGTRGAMHFVFQGDSFTAHASLGWRHVSGDLKAGTSLAFADASTFAVQGLPIARNAVAVNAGIDLTVNKRVKLGVSYDAQIAAHTVDAGVRGQVSWRF